MLGREDPREKQACIHSLQNNLPEMHRIRDVDMSQGSLLQWYAATRVGVYFPHDAARGNPRMIS